MRVGLVCPYALDVPGGVQAHVLGLAGALRGLGHDVRVLAPGPAPPVDHVTGVGRPVAVPYNGSVARVAFGPGASAGVRRWLRGHRFDVLHVHEPTAPSVALLALAAAVDVPVVATHHAATPRSRALAALGGVLRPHLERITARIAVSPHAREVQVQHLGGDGLVVPNGVDVPAFATAPLLPGHPRAGGTVAFVGRFDEPRKGVPVLLAALRALLPAHPGLRVLVVGRGDAAGLRRAAGPALAARLRVLGPVPDAVKASALRSADVLCVPATGGESFGVVLLEGMAAGVPVVAADLPAFRAVLDGGRAGVLVAPGDPGALSAAVAGLLADPDRRRALARAARARVGAWDWPVVARQVVRVYESAVAAQCAA